MRVLACRAVAEASRSTIVGWAGRGDVCGFGGTGLREQCTARATTPSKS
jgi:hypothetical protein